MVCKKDVVTWFKGLKSYKRTDVMCTLLNLCLPFELRFLGTCLEHLGKKDFHELRQSENEANSLSELNISELQCLNNQQVRTKLAVYVSLLYSCNYTCSNSIYKILTKNEDIHSVLKASSDDSVLDDLLLIYTLAINHPGFSFEQKVNLEKVYNQLQDEERRIYVQSASRNKSNFVAGNSQENILDKPPPPPMQGYPGCIAFDEHIIGVGVNPGQCPPMPPHPHHFSGDGSTMSGYPLAFPWQFLPTQESPLSRNSSPNSGSPPPSRVKFPPPRVPHPPPSADQLRESISKEMPTYATSLHPFNHEQLSRMCDEELREIGLGPNAVLQLRSILNRQTNGIGPADGKKKMEPPSEIDQTQTIRRYPSETLTVFPGVYSCYTIPATRKYHHPLYPAPQHLDFRQMRIGSDPSSSDESSPDTPPPHVEGAVADERLVGGGEERRGGGRGRSRHHPPGRPAVPRARGPHPDSRRREGNMSNGAGGNGSGEPGFYAPHGYLPPQYVRTPYPGGGFPGGGAGFMRAAYPPFQQPNGEIVYTYPPPPGGFLPAGYSIPQGGQVLQQPPPQQVQPKPLQPPPLSCYNCGSQSHSAVDCPEATIEEVTKQGQYRLDFTGGYQKPVTGVEQHVPADK